jgi:hypothetical protein
MTSRLSMKSFVAAVISAAVLVGGCRGGEKPAGDQASGARPSGLRFAMIA